MSDTKLVPVAMTFPPDLLDAVDARAKALDLNRSQYFRRLARREMEEAAAKAQPKQANLALAGNEVTHRAA